MLREQKRIEYAVQWEDQEITWELRSDLVMDRVGELIKLYERNLKKQQLVTLASALEGSADESISRRGEPTTEIKQRRSPNKVTAAEQREMHATTSAAGTMADDDDNDDDDALPAATPSRGKRASSSTRSKASRGASTAAAIKSEEIPTTSRTASMFESAISGIIVPPAIMHQPPPPPPQQQQQPEAPIGDSASASELASASASSSSSMLHPETLHLRSHGPGRLFSPAWTLALLVASVAGRAALTPSQDATGILLQIAPALLAAYHIFFEVAAQHTICEEQSRGTAIYVLGVVATGLMSSASWLSTLSNLALLYAATARPGSRAPEVTHFVIASIVTATLLYLQPTDTAGKFPCGGNGSDGNTSSFTWEALITEPFQLPSRVGACQVSDALPIVAQILPAVTLYFAIARLIAGRRISDLVWIAGLVTATHAMVISAGLKTAIEAGLVKAGQPATIDAAPAVSAASLALLAAGCSF